MNWALLESPPFYLVVFLASILWTNLTMLIGAPFFFISGWRSWRRPEVWSCLFVSAAAISSAVGRFVSKDYRSYFTFLSHLCLMDALLVLIWHSSAFHKKGRLSGRVQVNKTRSR